jgi:hypothetical protein
MAFSGLRIVVAGSMANAPERASATWAVVQYAVGLEKLGHDVLLLDPVDDGRAGSTWGRSDAPPYFRTVVERFGLDGRAALLRSGTRECVGAPYPEVLRFCRSADVLLNLGGALRDPALLEPVPVRARIGLGRASRDLPAVDDPHEHFFTTAFPKANGETRATGRATHPWPIPQPVVLEEWPVDGLIRYHALTAVGRDTWGALASREGGAYVALPTRVRARFLLAVAAEAGDGRQRDRLRQHGWAVVDRTRIAGTPDDYRAFLQGSIAGFGLAGPGRADPGGSWCGSRFACYLAAGRPVLIEDTGFGDGPARALGLLPFRTPDEVAAGVEGLHERYRAHARAARGIAESWFRSDGVLTRLLDRLGARPRDLSRPA